MEPFKKYAKKFDFPNLLANEEGYVRISTEFRADMDNCLIAYQQSQTKGKSKNATGENPPKQDLERETIEFPGMPMTGVKLGENSHKQETSKTKSGRKISSSKLIESTATTAIRSQRKNNARCHGTKSTTQWLFDSLFTMAGVHFEDRKAAKEYVLECMAENGFSFGLNEDIKPKQYGEAVQLLQHPQGLVNTEGDNGTEGNKGTEGNNGTEGNKGTKEEKPKESTSNKPKEPKPKKP